MAKKLKVFRTSMGFFDLAVAAPSMKAAADAWGADVDIFKRGFAEQTDDPKIVEATLAAPGVVLRRPVGSDGAFGEKAALPKAPEVKKAPSRPERVEANKKPDAKSDEKAKRDAAAAAREEAAALEREKKRQELERQKREAEAERARKERERAIAKADAAFERARARHDEAVASIKQRRDELDNDEVRESDRWQKEQQAHKDALKEAGA